MKSNNPLILTSDHFFDTIKFQEKSDIEKIAYMMFYVTEVAHLRNNMVPEIISDRIRDQYESYFQRNQGADGTKYTPIDANLTKQILDKNPEWFQKVKSGDFSGSDRNPKMKNLPYVLTEKKKEDLWSKFDKDIESKINLHKKRLFLDRALTSILFICILGLSILAVIHFFTKDDELVVTSVQEYAEKVKLDEYNPIKKSVLFVYYVTELTKMREVVNSTAIHDRITELQCSMPSQEELDKLLDSSEMFESNNRIPKAYSLSNMGIDYAENVVNSHIQKPSIPLTTILELAIPIILAIFSLCGWLMSISYSLGKQQ